MKKVLSIVILFCFITAVSKPALAQDTETFDYEEVKQGEIVPYDGLLFTYDGMTNALVRVQAKYKTAELEKDSELKRVQANLESVIKNKDAELQTKQVLYNSQLKTKQDVIDSLVKEAYWNSLKGFGGIAIGITAGVAIGFVVGVFALSK